MKRYPQSRPIARRTLAGLCVFGLLIFIAVAALACKGPLGSASPAISAGPGIDFEITIPGSPPVASARSTILTDSSVFKVKVYGLLLGAVTPPTVLEKVGSVWRGRAEDLTPGEEYRFYVWAYGEDFSVLYYGKTADPVLIKEDENARVDIITTAAASAIIDLRTPGPAGGLIFYDYDAAEGSVHPDGWRFLEAAPPAANDYYGTQWQTDSRWSGEMDRWAVGTGRINTSAIAAWQTSQSMSGTAILISDGLSLTDNGITHDDWFLPSMNELYEMYSVLRKDFGFGGFIDDPYWTSTEQVAGSDATVCFIDFTDGIYGLEISTEKDSETLRMRPVRAFSAAPLVKITYDANSSTSGSVPVDEAWYVSGQEVSVKGNLNGLLGPVLRDGIRQRFLGWSTDSGATIVEYAPGATLEVSADTTLYAVYTSDDSAVGKIGPAGGWIAYDKGSSYTNGWRYLEAAPVDLTGVVWMGSEAYIQDTSMDLGNGQRNTELIVRWFDANNDNAGNDVIDKLLRAGYRAYLFESGGFTDWFLPSFWELKHMLDNLRAGSNIGGFDVADHYWTSVDANYVEAMAIRPSDNLGSGLIKSQGHSVRTARVFADPMKETYLIFYDANGATGGSVPSETLSYHYSVGNTVTAKSNSGALVKENSVFAGWNTSADGSGPTYAAGSGTFSMPGNSLTLHAKWDPAPYNLIVNFSNGSVTANGTPLTSGVPHIVYHGSIVTLTVVPSKGYEFIEWTGDLSGSQNPAEISIQGAVSAEATFGLKTLFVSKSGNDSTGSGSSGNPYLTVKKALAESVAGQEIRVSVGTYQEAADYPSLQLNNNVYLSGGWNAEFTARKYLSDEDRSDSLFKTELTNAAGGLVVIVNGMIEGFTLKKDQDDSNFLVSTSSTAASSAGIYHNNLIRDRTVNSANTIGVNISGDGTTAVIFGNSISVQTTGDLSSEKAVYGISTNPGTTTYLVANTLTTRMLAGSAGECLSLNIMGNLTAIGNTINYSGRSSSADRIIFLNVISGTPVRNLHNNIILDLNNYPDTTAVWRHSVSDVLGLENNAFFNAATLLYSDNTTYSTSVGLNGLAFASGNITEGTTAMFVDIALQDYHLQGSTPLNIRGGGKNLTTFIDDLPVTAEVKAMMKLDKDGLPRTAGIPSDATNEDAAGWSIGSYERDD
jgi:hypothetical protein